MSRLTHFLRRPAAWAVGVAASAAVGVAFTPAAAVPADLPKAVADAQAERVKAIALVRPAVAAVCFYGGQVCGSGVVISDDGYCLTNYHVTAGVGAPVMQCGLADGQLYDTVLVGTDKVGDVALVKLLPKKDGDKFPFVKLGDSDQVKQGDWSLAMGNPFGLALDFTPTVTYGLVSGVNRYQPPEGKGTLEYTDCIQIDTSINPGNSGGPLFNMKGELIGINGRGSFEKRGRVNSGVGYAISINQIKNFYGALHAGLDVDHATLGAAVSTQADDEGVDEIGRMVLGPPLTESDASRRGLKELDQLYAFNGRVLTSTNQYKNALGVYPKGWRVPVITKRPGDAKKREALVRLMGNTDTYVEKPEEQPPQPQPGKPQPGKPGPGTPPGGGPPGAGKGANSPAAKLYEAKKGFANFHYNTAEQDKILAALKKAADLTAYKGSWAIDGTIELSEGRRGEVKISWEDDKDGHTVVSLGRTGLPPDTLTVGDSTTADLALPQGSGGLLLALNEYRLLLHKGRDGFKKNDGFDPGFVHLGVEPVYPPAADGKLPAEGLNKTTTMCDVIRTKTGAYDAKWYFAPTDHALFAAETWYEKDEDPCELFFSDHRDDNGNGLKLPHKIVVRYADKLYAVITVKSYLLNK